MPDLLSEPPGRWPQTKGAVAAVLRLMAFFLVAVVFAVTTQIATPIRTSPEMFHEGEYVGSLWHMKDYQSRKAPFPVLIHGAMDYVPSQIAHALYGSSRIIGGTRVVNTAIVVLAWILFMELVFQLAAAARSTARRAGLAVFLFALLAPPWFSLPVQVTEAFVGSRDVFLLLLLLAFVLFWQASPRWSPVLAAAGAALLPLAIPWSYDRGLIATAFTGLMLGAMILRSRWWDLTMAASGIILCSILLERSRAAGTFLENLQNIHYWIRQSGEIWGLPFHLPEHDSMLGLLLLLFCVSVAALALREWHRNRDPAFFWITAGLLVIQLLLAKTSLNRPAGARVLMALFPSILLLVYSTSPLLRPRLPAAALPSGSATRDAPNRWRPWVLRGLPVALLSTILAMTTSPVSSWVLAGASFLQAVAKPRTDLKMVPPDAAALAMALRELPDPALFGWCNEGVIQLLARKRWATRFPYAIYAGPAHEAKLLEDLKAMELQVIVSRPDAWSMAIDGRPMAGRLPAVDAYLHSRFTVPRTFGSYLLLQPPPQ